MANFMKKATPIEKKREQKAVAAKKPVNGIAGAARAVAANRTASQRKGIASAASGGNIRKSASTAAGVRNNAASAMRQKVTATARKAPVTNTSNVSAVRGAANNVANNAVRNRKQASIRKKDY